MRGLTPEDRAQGRYNATTALGVSRRDLLRAAAAAPALGAFYFGYASQSQIRPVRAAVIGTGNEGCGAMIAQHNRDYLEYIGYCDARPTNMERARRQFAKHDQYSEADVKNLRQYDDLQAILNDDDVEVVVIALPLWLHAPVAIEAMKAGKHVFTEKLMAHSIDECKQMCRVARETNRLLAVGHQRHYSVLYDNAKFLIDQGVLGDIRHIRALWHRNNAQPVYVKDKNGNIQYEADGSPKVKRDDDGNVVWWDSWKPDIPEADRNIDFKKYGYKSLDELIRWRLYDRTGAGLMAELGSHQLDACSIFLSQNGRKPRPLTVTGFGGTYYYTDNREVDDHVFVNFEMPHQIDEQGNPVGDERVVISYSSITTNAFDYYGETIMGTRGTMMVEGEKDILLYKERDRNSPSADYSRTTSVTLEKQGKKQVMVTNPSAPAPTSDDEASLGGLAIADPSRGYREELEHFAWCLRNGNESNFYDVPEADKLKYLPRCTGEVGLADAVMALTANIAMRQGLRIPFDPDWFDYTKDATPEKQYKSGLVAKA